MKSKPLATNTVWRLMTLGTMWMACGWASAGDLPKPAETAGRVMLPQEHQYQRQLRAYMATLTKSDFEHGVTTKLTEPPSDGDLEAQYRNFILTQLSGGVPLVGSKRGVPAVNNPAELYLLSSIERATAIELPLGYPESLMTLVLWDYPGNVYFNNRALKMRCFINAAVNMMMLDDHLEKNPRDRRGDWRAYQLVIFGAPYAGFRDLLPIEIQQAYQFGVKKLAQQLMTWGPRREDIKFDMILPIGLWYASQVCNDPALNKEVEDFARGMFADPQCFHPAGYWVERGGPDTGFGGQANVFVAAAALASDWPFAKEALERAYRLRSHLILPEPDGTLTGPSAFNTRLSSPAHVDQWEMGVRNRTAAMLTDEAACTVKLPTPEVLAKAAASRAAEYNRQIAENPLRSYGATYASYVYWRNEDLPPQPWKINIFANWQFPLSMNFGYEFYKKGAYARLAKLEADKSPLLKYPMERGETFVRDFAKAFVVARMPDYGAILHTGPVGSQTPDNGIFQLPTAAGLGGGQLSAFWTPATGSVILARRGGMIHETHHDKLDEWRTWPIHAVSGLTAEGKVFTSARIVTPETEVVASATSGTAKVRGQLTAMRVVDIPAMGNRKAQLAMYDEALAGKLDYARTFNIESGNLRVETKVAASGEDKLAELYETIPVYLRDTSHQPKAEPTVIEFQVSDKWAPATAEYANVTAVKLTRFDGAVRIDFDKPARIKLSATEWKDPVPFVYGACRNLMIDLLPAGKPTEFKEASVGYTIAAVKK